MSRGHWSEMEVAWLRSIVPELGCCPVYVRDFDELPNWMQEQGTHAWSSPVADLQMKEILKSRNQWEGRGHFIAVSNAWRWSPLNKQRGVLLHEMAHSLSAFDAMMRRDESTFGEIEAVLIAPGGRDTIRQRFNLPSIDHATETRLSHNQRWVRCCLHLAVRAWDFCTLSDMVVFSSDYSLQEEHSRKAIQALLPEIHSGRNLIEILKSEPPEEFAKLFQ